MNKEALSFEETLEVYPNLYEGCPPFAKMHHDLMKERKFKKGFNQHRLWEDVLVLAGEVLSDQGQI